MEEYLDEEAKAEAKSERGLQRLLEFREEYGHW